ncbi:MAG: glycosyltransferase family 9 protein [Bdellovibrionales bacterium]|jgi:ADP-heptose:LPS heptosyltransferase|nr:glycosyltransferase family 9 protein [Bdellovibrionales bacterium]
MTLKKNKLLIIRFSSIGDIVQAMSVIPTLSDYEIHWATKTEFSNLVSLSLEVKKVWKISNRKGIIGLISLAIKLRKEEFDIIYDAHSSLRSHILKILMFRFNTKVILRKKERLKRFLLFKFNKNYLPNPYRGMKSFLAPLKKNKIIPNKRKILCNLNLKSERIDSIIKYDNFIALAPSAAWEMKRWPEEKWIELVDKMPNNKFIVLGGPNDYFCQNLENLFPDRVQNFAGSSSLVESFYLISKSKFIVSGDTGMIHMADLLNKNGVLLLGPTAFGYTTGDSIQIIELDLSCRPCTKDGRGKCYNELYKRCMQDISVEKVLEKINL